MTSKNDSTCSENLNRNLSPPLPLPLFLSLSFPLKCLVTSFSLPFVFLCVYYNSFVTCFCCLALLPFEA